MVCEEKERKICKEAEAKERLVCKEAERVVREEAERVTQIERCQQEKLDLFLNKSITAEEFEKDLEAEDKGTKGGRKWAPSSPPKLSRKRACMSTTITSKPTAMEKADSRLSTVNTCNRCCHFEIKCVPTDGGARCSNCKAKHYKCLLVPSKEGLEGKGVTSGMHHLKTVTRGRAKAQEKKEAAKKAKAFHRVMLGMFLFLFLSFWDSLKLASRSWS